ncbi:hypothetical protein PybrP1_000872 [[Pythium] brassicae (nom. inval.)]|nr:hypothetical protein PybrP1_000872 [[Pythium] brassicae (nom. inval.)]
MGDAPVPPPLPTDARRIPPPPPLAKKSEWRQRKPPPREKVPLAAASPTVTTAAADEAAAAAARPRRERKPREQPTSEPKGDKAGAADKKPPPAPAPKEFLPDLPTPASFRDAVWFAASGGDLRFAQWLFGRAQGLADVDVVHDAAMLARVHRLYALETKVRQELENRSEPRRAADGADGGREEDDSAGDADEALEEEEEEEGELPAVSDDDSELWAVASIAADCREGLTASRLAALEPEPPRSATSSAAAAPKGKKKKKPKRVLEKVVMKQLTENATELLISRAGYDDIPVLEDWLAFVSMGASELKQQLEAAGGSRTPVNAEASDTATVPEPEPAAATAPADATAKPTKRDRKRQQKQEQLNGKRANTAVGDRVRVFIAFLRECHALTAAASAGRAALQPPPAVALSPQLADELMRVYLAQRISDAAEGERLGVALYLQQALRRGGGKWRHCSVVLFGSSLSLYGSVGSDLDLCLLLHPDAPAAADSAVTKVLSGRQLRAMVNGGPSTAVGSTTGGSDLSMVELQELHLQATKSVQKVALQFHDLSKRGAAACSPGQLQQLQQLRFFHAHLALLQDALRARVDAIGAGDDAAAQAAAAAVGAAAAARMKELVAKSRRQTDDLFRVRAALERANCRVRVVLSGARIPIIRFVHLPTALECDLCFENVLATRNTFLLRAYAALDERARALGVAVKHWAKQRQLSDASQGFLSSYSFVLLTIYFLQAAAGVVPSLQDPALLAAAGVAPALYNGVDTAFCTDRDAAQRFLAATQTPEVAARAAGHTLPTLLAWFFAFYATEFDFARRVVAVRTPAESVDKRGLWGARKARSWRLSIQDPLETSRDLGSVLQFQGQEKILREFKRADELLRAGKSFADVAEAARDASRPAQKAAGARGGKQQPAPAAAGQAKPTANKENVRGGSDGPAKQNARRGGHAAAKAPGHDATTTHNNSTRAPKSSASKSENEQPRNRKFDRKEKATPAGKARGPRGGSVPATD